MLAVPVGLLASAILVVNNVRDLETDRRAGKRTLAVRLGPRAHADALRRDARRRLPHRRCCRSSLGSLSAWLALPWLTLPLAWRLQRTVRHAHRRPDAQRGARGHRAARVPLLRAAGRRAPPVLMLADVEPLTLRLREPLRTANGEITERTLLAPARRGSRRPRRLGRGRAAGALRRRVRSSAAARRSRRTRPRCAAARSPAAPPCSTPAAPPTPCRRRSPPSTSRSGRSPASARTGRSPRCSPTTRSPASR